MDRIDKILNHNLFLYHLRENEVAEENRIFCRHGMTHFLDVARIGVIINLEENLGIDKELIYAAALLHDLGRHVQYEVGQSHEKASAEIAPAILRECGFDDKETGVIIDAILHHRDGGAVEETGLRGILYRADKAGRACFACEAQCQCNWDAEKKNSCILY